ncbi:aldehyde ferredoxin oxidoreductase family protein [Desulfobacula sp.]|uniref:aldehyde ferredoxin oxidoreductase family protein n=1 Tax=Desulfobacula sp. TaxID=2593537 RepID=UPI00260AB22B|nr:aldehyde ferredoxin oxidoreductase family protein [Desulfobacula sp.]
MGLCGWKGKILRVDLTRGKIGEEDLSDDLMLNYIGGRIAGNKILLDEMDPMVDPLGPDNKLIFATGPLTGTGVPAGGRFIAVSKSPLTGGIANPCCGGYFGANLKYAGYDFLIIEGKSPEPAYLSIVNDQVTIKPAEHLWGKWATETENAIRAELSDSKDAWGRNTPSVLLIGPAGENLVSFASIMSDGGRALGRSGLGAVMGSKNLKAIGVKGTGEVRIADVKGFQKAIIDFIGEARETGQLENRSKWGTWDLIGRAQKTGTLCSLNFKEGDFDGFKPYEDPATIRDKIRVRDEACFGCPFRCGKRSTIFDPAYPGTAKGPEHETLGLFGSNCGVADLDEIWKANYLCNELGMDTITGGATISCAMELYELGYLTGKTIGYPLNFGNGTAILELLKKTAFRKDFGDQLADGGYAVAERAGHPELFMGVKKQGFPAWHPQGRFPGLEVIGLQYATSPVGASHTKSVMTFHSQSDDLTPLVAWTKHYQDYVSIVDAGVLCWIIYHGPMWEDKASSWLELVTGVSYSQDKLMMIGEKNWNMERLFNLAAGLSSEDDGLPQRMLTEAPPRGGRVVDLPPLLEEYHRIRGWDNKGVPKPEKLEELGLSEWKVKVQ